MKIVFVDELCYTDIEVGIMVDRIKALEMRLAGKTYQEIGEALGVTKQHAHQVLTEYNALGEAGFREKTKLRRYRASPEYKATEKERRATYQQELHQFIKETVLVHYGKGKCACVRCGFNDIRALSIDHVNGKGNQHRQSVVRGGHAFYGWLRKEGFPKGYQTLCMNCQWIKRSENREFGTT